MNEPMNIVNQPMTTFTTQVINFFRSGPVPITIKYEFNDNQVTLYFPAIAGDQTGQLRAMQFLNNLPTLLVPSSPRQCALVGTIDNNHPASAFGYLPISTIGIFQIFAGFDNGVGTPFSGQGIGGILETQCTYRL